MPIRGVESRGDLFVVLSTPDGYDEVIAFGYGLIYFYEIFIFVGEVNVGINVCCGLNLLNTISGSKALSLIFY